MAAAVQNLLPHLTYARAWVSVKSTYGLSATENEKTTLTDMLGTCPS
ncbi:hypothetical protein SSPS47_03675 [Streptomyces sp. S4.7]|nr:hypothetical protein SSPS47_03675 [Streptomyces sp. S4.7]